MQSVLRTVEHDCSGPECRPAVLVEDAVADVAATVRDHGPHALLGCPVVALDEAGRDEGVVARGEQQRGDPKPTEERALVTALVAVLEKQAAGEGPGEGPSRSTLAPA